MSDPHVAAVRAACLRFAHIVEETPEIRDRPGARDLVIAHGLYRELYEAQFSDFAPDSVRPRKEHA